MGPEYRIQVSYQLQKVPGVVIGAYLLAKLVLYRLPQDLLANNLCHKRGHIFEVLQSLAKSRGRKGLCDRGLAKIGRRTDI